MRTPCGSLKVYAARDLAPVVQKVDNAIQRIAWFVLSTFIRWIAIYPVDSVIQPLNNRGQDVWEQELLLSIKNCILRLHRPS